MQDDYEAEVLLEKIEGIKLSDLAISTRMYNCLRRSGYSLLSDIVLLDDEQLVGIKNLGKDTMDEIHSLQSFVRVSSREKIVSLVNCLKEDITYCKAIDSSYYENATLVQIVLQVSEDKLLFRDRFNQICTSEESIDNFELSTRTHNAIRRLGISSIGELANANYKSIYCYQGMGRKSLNELYDFVKSHISCYQEEAFKPSYQKYVSEEELNTILDIVIPANTFISKNMRNNISNSVSLIMESLDVDSATDNLLTVSEKVIDRDPVFSLWKEYITAIIKKSGSLTKEELNEYFENLLQFNGITDKLIDSLVDEKRIRVINGYYTEYCLLLDEWITTLKQNSMTAVSLRCMGKTLEEAGQVMNLTRERVRQLVSKALKLKPLLYEDMYAKYYTEYGFEDSKFAQILQIDMHVIYYYKLAYVKGTADLEKFIGDNDIPRILKERAIQAFHDEFLFLNGQTIPLRRDLLLKFLLSTYFSDEECTTDEFEKFYIDFLRERGLDDNEKLLFPTSRAFEARIIDYDYSISKYGRRIRYYDIDKIDVNVLISEIAIESYRNLEISTLKLFRENKDIMDRYDIRDEYELHSILKKKYSKINDKSIQINRMPFLYVGVPNRNKQVEELLFQMAPISNIDLAIEYEQRYGVRKETVLANFFSSIDVYLHDGIFDIEQKAMPRYEFENLRTALKEEFYLWDDIIQIYDAISDEVHYDSINAMTLKQMGFKVYSQYLLSNNYPSAENFFEHILLQNEIMDIASIDAKMKRIQIFSVTFTRLRDELELIEIEKNVFYRNDYFRKCIIDIDKQAIYQVAEDLAEKINKPYYNIVELDKVLCEYECFQDIHTHYFVNSVLRVSGKTRSFKCDDNYIIATSEKEPSQIGLVVYSMELAGSIIKLDDLIEYIEKEYWVHFDRSKVIYLVKDSNRVYYDGLYDLLFLRRSDYEEYQCGVLVKSPFYYKNLYQFANRLDSQLMIVQFLWRDKYVPFINYCGSASLIYVKDLLNLDFRKLYNEANNEGLTKGLIMDIVCQCISWIETNDTKDKEDKQNSCDVQGILDIFFK